MRTKKNLKTSLEPLQPLNLLNQYFLVIKDQQQVLKDQLSVTALLMKKVNVVIIQCTESRFPKRTQYYPGLYVLTDDEHLTITPETHKYAAAAGSFCFLTTENGIQLDICNSVTIPCVQQYHCTSMTGPTTSEIWKLKFQKEVDGPTRHMLERCVVTCGRAAGTRAKMRSRARKHQLKKYKDTANSLLQQNTLIFLILDWQRGFGSHGHKENEAENVRDRKMGAHHQHGQTR